MPTIPLSWSRGIDNVSNRTGLPEGTVADAVNVDIDRSGIASRRDGYSLVASGVGHSLWTSEARAESFMVLAGVLCKVTMPWATTALQALTTDAPMSFCDLNGDVIASSKFDLYAINPGLVVRRLGLETPGAPGLAAASSGGLDAGSYGVAIAYVYGDEEGPLSPASFVTLTAGQGLTISAPQPLEGLATRIRVYRTPANGDILYRAGDIPLALSSYILGVGPIGRQANNQFLERMPPGDMVCAWRGLLWTVRSNVAFHSERLRYGVYDPRFNFIQFGGAIRMFLPVESGIFVGTREGVFFVAGSGPKEFTVRKTGAGAPVSGSGRRLRLSLTTTESGEYAALWLGPNGYVMGMPDGSIKEIQKERIQLSANSAVGCIHDGRALTIVS